MSTKSTFTSQSTLEIEQGAEPMKLCRILLLEDDLAFSDILRRYLESVLFDVTAVTSGVEGLRAVMARDFDVIVCDMLMPTVPGDMFYRAVERTKPHLCKRFIFITGYKGVPRIDDFIKSINGTILPKPFHMDDIKELIHYTLSRR